MRDQHRAYPLLEKKPLSQYRQPLYSAPPLLSMVYNFFLFTLQKTMTEFVSGQWYRWTGGSQRPDDWNPAGEMDFLLDGKPHQVREGSGDCASFFDSPDPEYKWRFAGQLGKFECVAPEKDPTKKLLCPKEHILTAVTHAGSWTCDVCQTRYPSTAQSMCCPPCNFDMCERCAAARQGPGKPADAPVCTASASFPLLPFHILSQNFRGGWGGVGVNNPFGHAILAQGNCTYHFP